MGRLPVVRVLICTRNRADSIALALPHVVAAVEASDYPADIIVVDNGSTDTTASTLRILADVHEEVRIVHDPLSGLACTHNRALASVGAENICSPAFLNAG